MAADYYSLIARAVSGLPNNTEEARRAIYDCARAALRERLDTHVPPISEAKFAHEHFALEAAINKVEEDLLFSVMHRFVRETPTLSVTSVVKEFARSPTCSGTAAATRWRTQAMTRAPFRIG